MSLSYIEDDFLKGKKKKRKKKGGPPPTLHPDRLSPISTEGPRSEIDPSLLLPLTLWILRPNLLPSPAGSPDLSPTSSDSSLLSPRDALDLSAHPQAGQSNLIPKEKPRGGPSPGAVRKQGAGSRLSVH